MPTLLANLWIMVRIRFRELIRNNCVSICWILRIQPDPLTLNFTVLCGDSNTSTDAGLANSCTDCQPLTVMNAGRWGNDFEVPEPRKFQIPLRFSRREFVSISLFGFPRVHNVANPIVSYPQTYHGWLKTHPHMTHLLSFIHIYSCAVHIQHRGAAKNRRFLERCADSGSRCGGSIASRIRWSRWSRCSQVHPSTSLQSASLWDAWLCFGNP